MPTVSRGRALAYLAVVICLLGLGGKVLLAGRAPESDAPAATLAAIEAEPVESGAGRTKPLVVHVAGAVRRPGLYRLEEGSRVADAIRAAGGAKRRAALALLNLAAPIADGQQVLVPLRQAGARAAPPFAGAPPGPVPLNSATLEQLDALPGVGPVTAQKILDYREQHGSFTSIDELDAIPGIGPARLEQLRELVVL
jgi:competence protein ComEA